MPPLLVQPRVRLVASVSAGQVSDTREIVARRPTETNGISRSALLKEARLRSACSSDAADSDWQQAWGQHPQ